MKTITCIFLLLALLFALYPLIPCSASAASGSATRGCTPTPPDAMGPFYEPNAPVREKVGEGYVLTGVVRSSATCKPIAQAQIEFWLVGPDGRYDNEHRATMFADRAGTYTFESNMPPSYYGRPPHIHIRVSADGYQTLVTQHYPAKGATTGEFDLVLVPAQ